MKKSEHDRGRTSRRRIRKDRKPFYAPRLTARRITLLALLIVPVALLAISLAKIVDNELVEIGYYVLGVPILVFNVWEWTALGLIEKILEIGPAGETPRLRKRRQ